MVILPLFRLWRELGIRSTFSVSPATVEISRRFIPGLQVCLYEARVKRDGRKRAPSSPADRWEYNLDAAREFADGRLGALFYVIAGFTYYGGPAR